MLVVVAEESCHDDQPLESYLLIAAAMILLFLIVVKGSCHRDQPRESCLLIAETKILL